MRTPGHRRGPRRRCRGLWVPLIGLAVSLHLAAEEVPPPTLAERLCSAYDRVETVSCEVRKTIRSPQGTVRLLSRVFYKKPDRIHVENVSPIRRRIVADGRKLYYYQDGQRRGFSRPISELDAGWLASLRNVPGTPMEHLSRLRGIAEAMLPGSEATPIRAAYETPHHVVTLSCDATGRLVRIEFLDPSQRERVTAAYEYSQYVRSDDGLWFPLRHKGVIILPDGGQVEETRLLSNLAVNQPISESLFAPDLHFRNVEFSDRFEVPGNAL